MEIAADVGLGWARRDGNGPEIIDDLRSAPSRAIGEVPVFPSAVNRMVPTSRHTFQIWLRRTKHRLLRSIEDTEERERIQEEWAGTNSDTLRTIYDDVTPDDMRRAAQAVRA